MQLLRQICSAPVQYVKQQMKDSEFPEVRLKYLGVFKVHPGRAKGMISITQKKYEMGKITLVKRDKFLSTLKTYINKK